MPSEKTLKRIVIILGVLLVVGFAIVVGTIIYRATTLDWDQGEENAGREIEIQVGQSPGQKIQIPGGSTLKGFSGDGRILHLHLQTGGGEERIIVIDIETGRKIGDFLLEKE